MAAVLVLMLCHRTPVPHRDVIDTYLLLQGRDLEKKYGSSYFAYLLAVFAALSSALTVGLGLLAENLTGDPFYLSQCAAGFSGRCLRSCTAISTTEE